MLDRQTRLDLLQRILGLRHKLKVHDSARAPETHEDMAAATVARWDLEDEIKAIEEILEGDRRHHIAAKKKLFEQELAQEGKMSGSTNPIKSKPKKTT